MPTIESGYIPEGAEDFSFPRGSGKPEAGNGAVVDPTEAIVAEALMVDWRRERAEAKLSKEAEVRLPADERLKVATERRRAAESGLWQMRRERERGEMTSEELVAEAGYLIDLGGAQGVAERIERYPAFIQNEVVQALFATRDGGAVYMRTIDKYKDLNTTTAHAMIAAGETQEIDYRFSNFRDGALDSIAMKALLEWSGDRSPRLELMSYPEKFSNLDNSIVENFIQRGAAAWVAENLNLFPQLDHKEFALKLIEDGKMWALAKNLDKFVGLDETIVTPDLLESHQVWQRAMKSEEVRDSLRAEEFKRESEDLKATATWRSNLREDLQQRVDEVNARKPESDSGN